MSEEVDQNSKLFVGNLPFNGIDDAKLQELFEAVDGVKVVEARVITDRFTGKSRGFGFVTVESPEMAEKAIEEMNNKEIEGRTIFVNIARPQEKRDGGRNFDRPRN